jgi:hypothetical protein
MMQDQDDRQLEMDGCVQLLPAAAATYTRASERGEERSEMTLALARERERRGEIRDDVGAGAGAAAWGRREKKKVLEA